MSIELTAARRGLEEMGTLLIVAHGIAAQVSAVRLDAASGSPAPNEALRAWLRARLGGTQGEGDAKPPSGPLTSVTLAVVDAAERYQRAARVEAADEL